MELRNTNTRINTCTASGRILGGLGLMLDATGWLGLAVQKLQMFFFILKGVDRAGGQLP